MISADIQTVLPEILLSVYAMAALLGAVYTTKDDAASLLTWVTSGVFVLLAVWIGINGDGTTPAFGGMFVDDAYARFAKIVILVSAAAVLLMSENYMQERGLLRFEYPLLVALAVVGMMVMVSAGDLMALYMGLELQSLSLYVVASLRRDSLKSTEAGLKYFVLGALSSGLLLYGASLVYGFAGTTLFSGIIASTADGVSLGMLFGIVFLLAGFAFKVSAAPFHMWTPDVYEGSPTPVTGFFAAAPKLAAMAIIARLIVVPFGDIVGQWQQVIIVLAVLSMVVGALGAIVQTNIKRLMAYSSIANMGYALVPLAAGTVAGVQGMLIFMTIYIITVIGVFATILQMRLRNGMVEKISDLSGLSKSSPGMAICLTMFMVSLIGIPPWLGFFGKLFAFYPAVESGLIWLVVIALLASVISCFYYLRIIKTMWFDEPTREFIKAPRTTRAIALIAVLLVLPVLILPGISGGGIGLAEAAAQALFAQ